MKLRKIGSVSEANRLPHASPLPNILTFKKKAIRVLPDGKQIGEYYSDQTKTTIIYPNTFPDKENR